MNGDAIRHQQLGEVKWSTRKQRWQGSGYHSRPGGNDLPGRRTIVGDKHPNGVYEGVTEFKNNRPPPDWVLKGTNSGRTAFFPDSWSPQKIDEATTEAFNNSVKEGRKWMGESDGVVISGFFDPATGKIQHGFPAWVDEQ